MLPLAQQLHQDPGVDGTPKGNLCCGACGFAHVGSAASAANMAACCFWHEGCDEALVCTAPRRYPGNPGWGACGLVLDETSRLCC